MIWRDFQFEFEKGAILSKTDAASGHFISVGRLGFPAEIRVDLNGMHRVEGLLKSRVCGVGSKLQSDILNRLLGGRAKF